MDDSVNGCIPQLFTTKKNGIKTNVNGHWFRMNPHSNMFFNFKKVFSFHNGAHFSVSEPKMVFEEFF